MTAADWSDRYATTPESDLSWFEEQPATSLELIGTAATNASVIDVGCGESHLVDCLLERGYRDIAVLDISQTALTNVHERVGDAPVTWIQADIRDWTPDRTFDVWHDRAAYHFLIEHDEQQHYWDRVRTTLEPGGRVVIATFADDGPETCSGVPVIRYDERQLTQALGDGFIVTTTRREQHPTPTGGHQSFLWLVAERDE